MTDDLRIALEVGAAAIAVLVVAGLLATGRASTPQRLVALAMLVGGLLLAGRAAFRAAERAGAREALAAHLPTPKLDDEGGFVSSAACRACHPGEHASWHGSFHRTMTQVAGPGTVLAPFDGTPLGPEGRVRPFRRGDEYWVETPDPDWELGIVGQGRNPDSVADPPRVESRVTLATGFHHYQVYWLPSRTGNRQILFPWVWLRDEARWVPRESAFLRPPERRRIFQTWNDNCIHCHVTEGDPGKDPMAGTEFSTVAELGIGCESCHGPGAAHVAAHRDPLGRRRSRASGAADPTILHPGRLDAPRSAETCGQCHSISMPLVDAVAAERRFRPGDAIDEHKQIIRATDRNLETDAERSQWAFQMAYISERDPEFFRHRFWPDGMVRISGREYNGLIESPCYRGGDFSCLSCHSLHGYASPADQLRPGMEGDAACLQCHAAIGDDVAAHAHHDPGTPGAACMDCHMPHTTWGLLGAIRSHEVSSPDVATTIATGRPDACSLCHADRTLGWVADRLESWYGIEPPDEGLDREVAASVRWLLSGDAGQRGLVAWHLGREATRRASGRDWMTPILAPLLDDPYSAVRFVAWEAIRDLPGHDLRAYDFVGPEADRAAAAERALAGWPGDPARAGAATLLLDALGGIDRARLEALRAARDDTPLDLQE